MSCEVAKVLGDTNRALERLDATLSGLGDIAYQLERIADARVTATSGGFAWAFVEVVRERLNPDEFDTLCDLARERVNA